MLASGTTIEKTAIAVKCSEKTISTWKHKPEFLAAIRAGEDAIYEDALSLLKRTARAAIGTLIRNMDGKVSPYVQVSAASKLLEMAFEVNTSQVLTARLDVLEEVAKAIPHE